MSGSNNDAGDERDRAPVGRNEAVLRAVNDQIEDLNQAFAIPGKELAVVCECGQTKCVDQIQIVTAAYTRVRADATLLLVVPGHEDPKVAVVESGETGYVVVRKPPNTSAEIAASAAPVRRDPRERRRRHAINNIAKQMREHGMTCENDFEDVRHSMLPQQAEDFLASGLLNIAWRDVKIRLEETS